MKTMRCSILCFVVLLLSFAKMTTDLEINNLRRGL